MTESEANFINGLIYLISAGATPLFGFIIDRVGFNVLFLMVGCLITFLGHGFILVALFHATSIIFSPYMGTVFIGLGYSVTVSTLWPMVALIVPMTRQGTAYGNSKFDIFKDFLPSFLFNYMFYNRLVAWYPKPGFGNNSYHIWLVETSRRLESIAIF